MHLEKGSSFARRGQLLPPTIRPKTLRGVARLVAHYATRVVIALAKQFHDGGGPARISAPDRGNLDRAPARRDGLGYRESRPDRPTASAEHSPTLSIGALTFRHIPCARRRRRNRRTPASVARVVQRGARCQAAVLHECRALVMTASASYTGGLNSATAPHGRVRGAHVHRAHARRRPPLRLRGIALFGGISRGERPRSMRHVEERRVRRADVEDDDLGRLRRAAIVAVISTCGGSTSSLARLRRSEAALSVRA